MIPGDLGLGGHSGKAYAQTCSTGKQVPKRKRRPAPTLSIQVNKRLEAVQVAFEEKNYPQASELLNALARKRIYDFEMAMGSYLGGLLY